MQNTGHREITRNSGSGELANVSFQTFGELDNAFGLVQIGVLLFQQSLTDFRTADSDNVNVA